MSHLSLEDLARIVDEEPGPTESAHLKACAECRHELEDLRSDRAVLASLPALQPAAEQWQRLARQLNAEGLMRGAAPAATWSHKLVRLAAALALFALGALSGIAWAGGDRNDAIADAQVEPVAPETIRVPTPAPSTEMQTPARQASAVAQSDAADVVFSSPMLTVRAPRSAQEAAEFVRDVEALYYYSLTRVADVERAETGVVDPFARLPVLEAIVSVTRTGLGQAPADPVLNGYHLAALAQREATLKQIAANTTKTWY
jgi:hypothetical protein